MKFFKKLFNKTPKLLVQYDYNLYIINEQANELHEKLGITEKRADELVDICVHAYHKNFQLHECLEEVVSQCNHINEVVFATMIFNKVIEKYNSNIQITGFLKNMFGLE